MSNPLKRRKIHRAAAAAAVKVPEAPKEPQKAPAVVKAPVVEKVTPVLAPAATSPKVEKTPQKKAKKGMLKW